MISHAEMLDTLLRWVQGAATFWKEHRGDRAAKRDAVRQLLGRILTESLNTERYLVRAIADPSHQDEAAEWAMIQAWHTIGFDIFTLDQRDEKLNALARDVFAWSSGWISKAEWTREQNERSLTTTRRLARDAQDLLAQM